MWSVFGGKSALCRFQWRNETRVETEFKYVLEGELRILVVDDDPIMREFASVFLATPTVTIETADCGEAALARLEGEHFDLAMVDLDMPGIDGYEVLRRVRAHPRLRDMPVVIVTSNEDMGSIDRAYQLGATSFTTKPVNWRLLSYHLRFVLRAQRALAA